jgi:hypothetical protein
MRTQKWNQQLGSVEKLSYNVLELEMVHINQIFVVI